MNSKLADGHLVDLAQCTEIRQTLLARPPRIVHGAAIVTLALTCAAFMWAYYSPYDQIVKAPGRMRPVSAPMQVFNTANSGSYHAGTGGKVLEVAVKEGDRVKNGDLLVKLDTRHLDMQADQLKTGIRLKSGELAELKRQVELHDKLFDADLAKTEADYAQMKEQIRLELAHNAQQIELDKLKIQQSEATVESYRVTKAVGATSDFQLFQAQMDLKQNISTLKEAELGVDESRLAPLAKAIETIKKRHDYEHVQQLLNIAEKEDTIAQQKMELEKITLEQGLSEIRAPMDGVITEGELHPGDNLESGRLVFTMAQDERLHLEVVVSTRDAGLLKTGMRARIKFDAFDFQKYGWAMGTVDYVSPDSRGGEGNAASPGAEQPSGSQSSSAAQPGYIVRIALDKDELVQGNNRGKIRLGLTGVAEIIAEEDTLLGFLLRRVKDHVTPQ